MQDFTELFTLKIDIKYGTLIYSIHLNENIVPDYRKLFTDATIISVYSSEFFKTAMTCLRHSKCYNPRLIFILSGECSFTVDMNDMNDVRKLSETYDILSLNNFSDNDCFMLNSNALDEISAFDYQFSSWDDLNRRCQPMIKTGRLSADILVSNKEIEVIKQEEHVLQEEAIYTVNADEPVVEDREEVIANSVVETQRVEEQPVKTVNYNVFMSSEASSIFTIKEKKCIEEPIVKKEESKQEVIINEPEIVEEVNTEDIVTEPQPTDFTLWVYTLCYNEKKIIPFVVKYWKQYASHIIVYDNGSDDGSIDELKKYGDWIEIRHFDSDGLNDKINMDLKNSCWKEAKGKNIDFVQVCDFDEVLWSDDIKKELLEFKKSSNSIWQSKCYEVCTKEFPQNFDIFVHDNNDARCSFSSIMSKKILFRPDMIDDMKYEPGAHGCKPKGNVSYYKNDNIKMFHLKHLSEEYYLEKFHLGAQRLSNINKKRGWGFQYRADDDKLKRNFQDLYKKGSQMFSKNRLRVAVCAIAKMENHYIREWVEHYKKLGFDNIILYDNNDVDGERFDEVIDDYIKSGYVIVKDVRGKVGTVEWRKNYKSIQIECYDECFQTDAKKYDWIAFFDIDEFLMIEEDDKSIKDILLDSRYNDYDAIKVCWKYYDDNDLVKVENNDYNCVKRFTHHNDIQDFRNKQCKMFIKTNIDININSPHGVYNKHINYKPLNVCDTLGNVLNTNEYELSNYLSNYKIMWLNHYQYKTIYEYAYIKMNRKYPDTNIVDNNAFLFFSANKKTVEKESIFKDSNKLLKIALCGIAKNENRYIREWVEYYKKLGFDNIILCDNNDKEGEHFEDVINDYITSGYVKLEDYRGYVSNQSYGKDNQSTLGIAYKETYKKYYDDFDWILYCDIDEFLYIKDNLNIKQYLSNPKFKDLNGLRIYWKLYGDNNIIRYENKSVIERFDYEDNCSLDPSHFFKTVVKTNIDKNEISFTAHGPVNLNYNIPDVNMKKVKNSMTGNDFGNSDIFLKHFYTKSTEEFFTRKYKKTSAVCGNKSPRNYSKQYLMRDSKYEWGYFKTNEKTDEKRKFIDKFVHTVDTKQTDIININITTYPLRDKYLYEMLTKFTEQTILPNRIILWLAKEEYDENNIPQTIQKCLDEKLITDIKWIEKNIYCHKRYEVFKYFNDEYNIIVDDDMIYPSTFIEEIYIHAKLTNHITCYASYVCDYNGTLKKSLPFNKDEHNKLGLTGGCVCWPPNTFPIESYKYENIRDEICPKCDETWITSFLIKDSICIDGLYDFLEWCRKGKDISGSQDSALYKTMCKIENNNVRYRELCFAKVIKFLHIEDKVHSIWPNFNIEKCIK